MIKQLKVSTDTVKALEKPAREKKKSTKKTDFNQKPTQIGRASKPQNGGVRPNAGRKPGAVTKRTREIAEKLVQDGELLPLEYMLQTMRETPDKLRKELDDGLISPEEFGVRYQALQARRDRAAETAAPYIHPRLSSVQANVGIGGHEWWLAKLEEMEI